MATLIGTTHKLDVPQDIQTTYNWVVHPDTPIALVNRWGPLAGFDAYEMVEGDWTHPGSSRRITLDDGSHMTETIKTKDEPTYFDYELTDYSLPALRAVLKRSFGQWWFTTREDGGTHVVWTYSLEPRNVFAIPLVWLFVKTFYRAYVKAAMRDMDRISKRDGFPSATAGG